MVGFEEGREFRFRGDLYSQESTFPLVEYGFTQCVALPSRGANVLDLVLVNEPLLLSSLSVLDPVGNSDHDSIGL